MQQISVPTLDPTPPPIESLSTMATSSETPVQSPGTVSTFSIGTMDEKKDLPKYVSIAFQSENDDLADLPCV